MSYEVEKLKILTREVGNFLLSPASSKLELFHTPGELKKDIEEDAKIVIKSYQEAISAGDFENAVKSQKEASKLVNELEIILSNYVSSYQ